MLQLQAAWQVQILLSTAAPIDFFLQAMRRSIVHNHEPHLVRPLYILVYSILTTQDVNAILVTESAMFRQTVRHYV